MHPAKWPPLLYQLHRYFSRRQAWQDRAESSSLLLSIADDEHACGRVCAAVAKSLAQRAEMELECAWARVPPPPFVRAPWDFLARRGVYSALNEAPKRHTDAPTQWILDELVLRNTELLNSRQVAGGVIEFRELLYAYRRNTGAQVEYILDLMLRLRYDRRSRTVGPGSVDARRHVSVQQRFSRPRLRILRRLSSAVEPIVFVVPLKGRRAAFRRFVENFERVCLMRHDGKVRLRVVTIDGDKSNTAVVEQLQRRYGSSIITLVQSGDGEFSRGSLLQLGAVTTKGSDELLLFIDVDIEFSGSLLKRVRRWTERGKSAYFPGNYR